MNSSWKAGADECAAFLFSDRAYRSGALPLFLVSLEKAAMKTAVLTPHARRSDNLGFHLAYGATFPLFLAAEVLQRWKARASSEGDLPPAAERSVFAAARESTLIAISYALMARTTLRRFARQNRAERLS
jgi:hypothetical protein